MGNSALSQANKHCGGRGTFLMAVMREDPDATANVKGSIEQLFHSLRVD